MVCFSAELCEPELTEHVLSTAQLFLAGFLHLLHENSLVFLFGALS